MGILRNFARLGRLVARPDTHSGYCSRGNDTTGSWSLRKFKPGITVPGFSPNDRGGVEENKLQLPQLPAVLPFHDKRFVAGILVETGTSDFAPPALEQKPRVAPVITS
jgi:hypothetical protein